MSESQVASGQSVNVGDESDKSKDTVQYSTYSKLLSEKKKMQAEFMDLKAKLEEREQTELSEKGEIKKAYEKLAAQYSELKASRENDHKAFATKALKSEFRALASQMGARPEFLDDLFVIGKGYLSDLEFGEGYEVPQEHLKTALAKLQKDKSIFFGKSAVAPKDVNPGHGGPATKSLEDMSPAEIEAFAKANFE